MPTRLSQRFPPDYTGWPPAMAPQDFRIWRAWYPKFQPHPEAIYFDVGVGAGRPAPETATPDQRKYWLRVTQKRIDALLIYPDHLRLIEMRHDASINALGRLLTYKALLESDNPFGLPIKVYLVTDNHDRDLAALCARHRIHYTVIDLPDLELEA